MDNIYGWYPHKTKEDVLIFELIDDEWEISEDYLNKSDIKDDVHEIQELYEAFIYNHKTKQL